MNIAKLHLQQAQDIVNRMNLQGISANIIASGNNLFVIKGHKPNCICNGCPTYRENGDFL
jgi:hypothetical protein